MDQQSGQGLGLSDLNVSVTAPSPLGGPSFLSDSF